MNHTDAAGAVVRVSAITTDTISNTQGLALLLALKSALAGTDAPLVLDFRGVIAFSSSFLNSSLGALCEDRGLDVLGRLQIKGCMAPVLTQLRAYIADVRATVNH